MENEINKCSDCGCGKEMEIQYESSSWKSPSTINYDWNSNDGR